jgi:hypothetical protein
MVNEDKLVRLEQPVSSKDSRYDDEAALKNKDNLEEDDVASLASVSWSKVQLI